MADLSKMSDEELLRLAGEKPAQPKGPDLSKVSDDELLELAVGIERGPEPKGLMQQAGEAVGGAFEALESVTGAPTRAALSELTRTTKEFAKPEPSVLGNIQRAGSAFVQQFGEDPSLAPTGKEIAEKRLGLRGGEGKEIIAPGAGSGFGFGGDFAARAAKGDVSLQKIKGPTPAGMAGFVIDVSADPLNVLPAATIGKGVKAAGKGVAQGTKAALANSAKALRLDKPIKSVKESTKAATEALSKLLKPKQAEDFAELAEIARKNDIPVELLPPEVEFGEASLITRLEKGQRQGALGEDLLNQFDESLNKVRDAFETKIDDIGGGSTPANLVEAGERLRADYDMALDQFFDSQEVTFNKIMQQADEPIQIGAEAKAVLDKKIASLEEFAKRRATRGATSAQRAQAKDLLNTIDALKQNEGFGEYVQFWRDLGDAAFKNQNTLVTNPPDVRKLRELYFDVRDGLIDSVRTEVPGGAKMAADLIKSNEAISEILTEKSIVQKILGDPTKAPENIFKQATKDTRTVDALQAVLNPEQMQSVKAAYVKDMLKPGKDGRWTFANLRNQIRSRKNVLEKLLEPEELRELTNIVRLGDRYGSSILNASRTEELRGLKKFLSDTTGAVGQAVTNDQVREYLKKVARTPAPKAGLKIPQAARPARPLFGPRAIGPREAVGLRLPQAISRQDQEE